MAFVRPTLAELVDRTQADFVSRLPLSGAVLRRSLVHVLSRVLAGAAHMLHGHLEYVSRQLFADTAERPYLVRIGAIFGLAPTAATYATATATATGTNGVVIPANAVLLSPAGYEFKTNAAATIAGGTATLALTAVVAGAAPSAAVGLVLTLQSPIAGVSATATVTSVVDGVDEEDTEAFRARVLERLRKPPQGGATADYPAWAKEVAGVTRAWVYPQELGAGTVVVRFVRDNDASLIPDAGEVAAVQSFIDARRPVTATVTVAAPVAAPVAFSLSVSPNTTDVRAAVSAELADLIRRKGEPGAGLKLADMRTAIGSAAGLTDYTLTSPAANVTHTANQIATLGTVTFT